MSTLNSLGRNEMRSLYRYLCVTRAVEDRLETLFRQGHVVGGLYQSLGQEGTAVGSAFALSGGDWLAPSIRDAGALYVRGLEPREVFRQYAARAASLCSGKDNTNHYTVPALGLLGPISPLGTQLCVLNGVALSFRMREEHRVCLAYLGEGASRTSAAHEGLSLAAALGLPIVVVLEHNRWSFGTRSRFEGAVDSWADVALAYGMPTRRVDGNDVLEVYEATRDLVDRARRGDGPAMVVAETYRMKGHAQHDAQKYVPSGELEEWARRDPIQRFGQVLVDDGIESEAGLAALRDEVEAEVAAAADAVLEEPLPAEEEALARVHADPALDPDRPWTRRTPVGYGDLVPDGRRSR